MTGASVGRFPDGFLWGAATAAHQIEGNNVNSDWWVKEHTPGTSIVEPSGDAADSYHRYRDDMRLLADAGLNSYRFSFEWARIEPERGFVSLAELDHYRRMIDACLEVGLEPVVTLLHFTVPRWMHDAGFWLADDAAERFARYVDAVVPILERGGVRYVCTINEPNIAAMLAGTDDPANLQAGGLPFPDQRVGETLLHAHRLGMERLRAIPGVLGGWTVATQAFEASTEPGSAEQLASYGPPRDDWYLEVARGDDFVGVQAYTRTIIGPDGPVPIPEGTETTLTGWEYFPAALERGIRAAWDLSGVPVLVSENGIATDDDSRRIDYTRGALEGVQRAIDDGIDVRGYLHWSALDNYEWASGYRPTFGLIAVDRTTFVRTPKPSLAWLGGVARANGLPE